MKLGLLSHNASDMWAWLADRPLRRIGILVAVLVAITVTVVIAVLRFTGLPDNAAFRIHGAVVTKEQLQQRVKALRALYGVQRPDDSRGADKFNRDTAKSVAVSMTMDNAARERGIVIPEKTVQDTLAKFIRDRFPTNGRDGFIQTLGTAGASEKDVVDEVKRVMTTSKLFQQVTSSADNVTDEQVRRQYDTHKDRMVTPEQRHLRNIVVATKQEAQQLLQQLQARADFGSLASERSLDQSTRKTQGDLGMAVPAQLDKNYAKTAFSAKPHSYFGPVKTRFGWNVGQVITTVPPKPLSFDQVQAQLRNELRNKQKSDRWRQWLTNELTNANIEYADEYRPNDPNSLPMQSAEGTPR